MKIVTGAEASQFKSMLFRNYCKFSCPSGSVYLMAYEGRVRPRDPGNEDGSNDDETELTRAATKGLRWRNRQSKRFSPLSLRSWDHFSLRTHVSYDKSRS